MSARFRTISLFGLSDVKVQFTVRFHLRGRRNNGSSTGLAQFAAACRTGVTPQDFRPTSPVGEILRYRVVGPPGYSVLDLKDDPGLDPGGAASRPCRGVIDGSTAGGRKTKAYQVTLDQNKLLCTTG